MKRVLLSGDNLQDLCDEQNAYLDCRISAVETALPECLEEYESQGHSIEIYNKGKSYQRIVCSDDTIEDIRRNVDCVVDGELPENLKRCIFPNLDKDCSHVAGTAKSYCKLESYRPNCNLEEVQECAANLVTDKCGSEASDLVVRLGKAYFDIFPYCDSDDQQFQSLKKIFRKY